jgi:hypothetical protein
MMNYTCTVLFPANAFAVKHPVQLLSRIATGNRVSSSGPLTKENYLS